MPKKEKRKDIPRKQSHFGNSVIQQLLPPQTRQRRLFADHIHLFPIDKHNIHNTLLLPFPFLLLFLLPSHICSWPHLHIHDCTSSLRLQLQKPRRFGRSTLRLPRQRVLYSRHLILSSRQRKPQQMPCRALRVQPGRMEW